MSVVINKTPENNLYNEKLLPVGESGRKMSQYGLCVIWIGMSVQITVFAALAPMPFLFSLKELLVIFVVGCALISLGCGVAMDIGLRHGIPFPISAASSFGYSGAKFAIIVRMIPAAIFFSLNAFVGAQAINELFKIFLGFDNVYIGLAINVLLLVSVTIKGLKGIERLGVIIMPLLIVVGIYMMWVLLDGYGLTLTQALDLPRLGDPQPGKGFWFGVAVTFGLFSSVIMGFNDFTRECRSGSIDKKESYMKTNGKYLGACFVGIIPFLTFYSMLACMTIVISGGRTDVLVVISELIQQKSMVLAVIIQIFIVVAQMSTNTAANLLPNAYTLCNIVPKVSYKWSVLIVAVVACALQPWNYIDKLDTVLSLMSATAGPVMSIVLIDYYVFRKRELTVSEMYSTKGIYSYTKGWNIAAMAVYIVATLVSYLIFPNTSFFIGFAVALILYYFVAKLQKDKYPITIAEPAKN